jgi:hypothetical protein
MLFGLFALKFERFTVDFFLKLRNFKLLFIFPNFVYFDLVLVKNFMNLFIIVGQSLNYQFLIKLFEMGY